MFALPCLILFSARFRFHLLLIERHFNVIDYLVAVAIDLVEEVHKALRDLVRGDLLVAIRVKWRLTYPVLSEFFICFGCILFSLYRIYALPFLILFFARFRFRFRFFRQIKEHRVNGIAIHVFLVDTDALVVLHSFFKLHKHRRDLFRRELFVIIFIEVSEDWLESYVHLFIREGAVFVVVERLNEVLSRFVFFGLAYFCGCLRDHHSGALSGEDGGEGGLDEGFHLFLLGYC
jgi:hypothetical protein